MFVLDTNVVSEILKTAVDPRVAAWVQGQATELLWTTALVEAELLGGVAILPDGRRKLDLLDSITKAIGVFGARILPFDRLRWTR